MKIEKIQPFFTRYLETQQTTPAVTKKYPSDNEDGGTPSNTSTMVTMRYPSDGEDMGSTPLKSPSTAVTMRYPSDQEDSGTKPPSRTYQTMKYPSDSEDAGACPGHHNNLDKDIKSLQDLLKKFLEQLMNLFGGGSAKPKPGNVVTLKFPSDTEDMGK